MSRIFVCTNDITVVMAPGIQIDNETPEPEDIPQCIIDDYDKIKIDTLGFSTKWTDKSKAPQESYPIPIREYNGQK